MPAPREGTARFKRSELPPTERRLRALEVDRLTRERLARRFGPRFYRVMEDRARRTATGGWRVESGYVLVAALGVMLVCALLSVAVVQYAASSVRDADRFSDGIAADHAAEGCMTQGVAVVTGWPTAGSYEADCWSAEAQEDGTMVVTGWAEVGKVGRSVSVVVDQGEVVPRSWASSTVYP